MEIENIQKLICEEVDTRTKSTHD